MSVSRKVLKNMKKVMGVISAIPVLTSCSSQISCAKVNVKFDSSTGTLRFSGDGNIGTSWKTKYSENAVKSVVIGDNVKKIGRTAFSDCNSLEKIIITSPITEVGEKAFWRCESLQEINIPNSVTSVGEAAFCGCKSLQEINIPNSVNTIGNRTFANCASLKKIDIPNFVNTIGYCAFQNCTSLKEITIPNSVQFIYEHAFASSGLERVKFEDMSRCNSKSCWAVLLHPFAFSKCAKLRLLDISGRGTNMSRIVKVDKDAFWGNDTNMSRIVKVENGAFEDCDQKFRALEGSTVRAIS